MRSITSVIVSCLCSYCSPGLTNKSKSCRGVDNFSFQLSFQVSASAGASNPESQRDSTRRASLPAVGVAQASPRLRRIAATFRPVAVAASAQVRVVSPSGRPMASRRGPQSFALSASESVRPSRPIRAKAVVVVGSRPSPISVAAFQSFRRKAILAAAVPPSDVAVE